MSETETKEQHHIEELMSKHVTNQNPKEQTPNASL